jgi:protein SCO1/2
MRARQWILMAFAGLLGFSVAALCVVYAVSLLGPVHGTAATTQIGGPFTLVDDNGATVTEKNIAGKPYVMYFGYTFCPDVVRHRLPQSAVTIFLSNRDRCGAPP